MGERRNYCQIVGRRNPTVNLFQLSYFRIVKSKIEKFTSKNMFQNNSVSGK